jgi:hypothetical protein
MYLDLASLATRSDRGPDSRPRYLQRADGAQVQSRSSGEHTDTDSPQALADTAPAWCPAEADLGVLKAECRHLHMVVTPWMRHALRQALLGLCLPGGHGSGVAHRIDLTRQLVPAARHRD